MSAAAAAPSNADAAPKKGKKKLVILVAAAALVLAAAGGGAMFFLKKGQAEDGEEGDVAAEQHEPQRDSKAVPKFVVLEPFTVNLADRDTERYAQVGVTLEVDDDKTGERLKAFMPVIRNNILMVLAHKSSADVLTSEGKRRLAAELRAETLRPLGYEVEVAELLGEDPAAAEEAPKKKKKKRAPVYPVKAVHFANFIVQ